MVIMLIMGLVSLRMFQLRNVLIAEDLLRLRLFYSAEGCVEIMRESIDILMKENTDSDGYSSSRQGYLASKFPVGVPRYVLEGDMNFVNKYNPALPRFSLFATNKSFEEIYDLYGNQLTPRVLCRVYCECLGNDYNSAKINLGVDFPKAVWGGDPDTFRYYRIVAEASSTYSTSLGNREMSARVSYYFCTQLVVENEGRPNEKYKHTIYFVEWRKN